MATTRAVVRDAPRMARRLSHRRRTAPGPTRALVLGGDTHVSDKVLSVFEPHTALIRTGKIAKPNKFGNLVTIQEAEHPIITAYEVHAGRPADGTAPRCRACCRPRPPLARDTVADQIRSKSSFVCPASATGLYLDGITPLGGVETNGMQADSNTALVRSECLPRARIRSELLVIPSRQLRRIIHLVGLVVHDLPGIAASIGEINHAVGDLRLSRFRLD